MCKYLSEDKVYCTGSVRQESLPSPGTLAVSRDIFVYEDWGREPLALKG